MNYQSTEQGLLTLDFINQTNQHIFLTGKAGTGKTTLLKEIIQSTYKRVVVVAPTGIAALNAGGVTMHSMFQLPLASFIPSDYPGNYTGQVYFETPRTLNNHHRMSREKLSVIRQMEVLVIDEVSMLRADTLDAMDYTLRRVRRSDEVFGGVQMLFIGDLMQLPPVVKNDEWNLLSKFYPSMFFFQSKAVQKSQPIYIELSTIFRQEDPEFIGLLNRLRDSEMTEKDWQTLDQYVKPNFKLSENPGFVLLTTHNYKADQVNKKSLEALPQAPHKFFAEITGEFPEKIFPVDPNLELKIGAQVMFVRNDQSAQKRYYNGKIGEVEVLTEDSIKVRCHDDNQLIEVELNEWENEKYSTNEQSKELEKEVIGTFVQYPLRLAWAITVHKSQGLTFSKAALDVQDVFQPGQAYVAFSRLQSMEGMVLLNKLRLPKIEKTQELIDYTSKEFNLEAAQKMLDRASEQFMSNYIKQVFNVESFMNIWKQHLNTYFKAKEGSIKAKHANWANNMTDILQPLKEVSQNFQRYIDGNFKKSNYETVNQKIDAAKGYFMKQMEAFSVDLMSKLIDLKKQKQTKAYFNELYEIEEQWLLFVQRLSNCHSLVVAFTSGEKLNKKLLSDQFIPNYRKQVLALVQEKLATEKPELLEDNTADYRSEKPKNKDAKPEKIPTTEITFQMWKAGKTIEEIAKERVFTKSTIEGHFEKLIEEEKMDIGEVLDKTTFDKIMAAFDKLPDAEGTKPIKEILGDEISFGQIKMVMGYRKLVEKITD
jgi:energy-coupling factor transporter ATP-binding protein EcfA2